MAQDDMHVIMYKILAYLYDCMKKGIQPQESQIRPGGIIGSIPELYWARIMEELSDNYLVKGIGIIHVYSGDIIVNLNDPTVTFAGVEFLQENSMMKKAAKFLKEAKSTLPFL